MNLSKSEIFDLTTNHITSGIKGFSFKKYQKKIYVFEIDGEDLPEQSLLIRVHLNRRIVVVTLKSIHDKALSSFKTRFHSDGIFNKHYWLFNSDPSNPYFPDSISYRFDNNKKSFISILDRIILDYNSSGRDFYTTTPKMKEIIDKGIKFLGRLNVNPIELAESLDQESKNGRFFKRIDNSVFLDLAETIKVDWDFKTSLPGFGGDNNDKLYYFSFNFLYYYINTKVNRPIQNIIYRE